MQEAVDHNLESEGPPQSVVEYFCTTLERVTERSRGNGMTHDGGDFLDYVEQFMPEVYVPMIVHYANSNDPESKLDAISMLANGMRHDPNTVYGVWSKLLADKDADVRRSAVDILEWAVANKAVTPETARSLMPSSRPLQS